MKKHIVCIITFVLLVNLVALRAAETWTNFNWVALGLRMPKTNLLVGEPIPTSISCSNTFESGRYIYGKNSICGPWFASYRVTELASSKLIECIYTPNPSASGRLDILYPHKNISFQLDLAPIYHLTNAGTYTVQAMGIFTTNEIGKTLSQQFILTTPPIIVKLLSKPETNKPSQTR